MYPEYTATAYKKIVLIRTECTNKNMGMLLQVIRETRRSPLTKGIINDGSFLIQEYALSTNNTEESVLQLYKDLLKNGRSPTYFFENQSEKTENYRGKTHYIFDLVYEENSCPDKFENMQDTVFLQYLLLVLNRLAASKIGFNVFISSATGELTSPHCPLSYEDSVAKMRTFLSFCAQSGPLFPEYSLLLDRIRILYQYKNSAYYWSPFFSDTKELMEEASESEPIGRIVPFIPINRETYHALQEVFDEAMLADIYQTRVKEKNHDKLRLIEVKLQLFRLYENYLDRYIRLFPACQKLFSLAIEEEKKRLPPQVGVDVRDQRILKQIKKAIISDQSGTSVIRKIVESSRIPFRDIDKYVFSVGATAWEAFVLRLLGIKKNISPKQLTAYLIAQGQLPKKGRDNYAEGIQAIARHVTELVDDCENNNSALLLELKSKLMKCVRQIREIVQSDTILERLLFMATLFYLEESEIETIKAVVADKSSKERAETMARYYWGHFSADEISLLHEYCIDYAQGVFQAIENAWFHVIKSDENGRSNRVRGCGGLTIRVRKKEDLQSILADKHNAMDNLDPKSVFPSPYFIEIYVTDLQYTYNRDSQYPVADRSYSSLNDRPFESIVRVFYKNVKKRANKETGEDDATCSAAQQFINSIVKGEEYDPYLGRNVPVYNNRVTLSQLFGKEESEALTEYLQNEANIAYHYGLQILSNVVETGNGYMMVRSGEGESNYYASDNKNYKSQNVEWTDGTAYVLLLPIKLKKKTNYQDTIAVSVLNNTETSSIETYPIILPKPNSLEQAGESVQKKNEAVNELRTRFNEIIKKQPNKMFIIDCTEYKSGLDYEVLAKAVFRCAAQAGQIEKKGYSPSFALINVKNKHEVVKLFRQFTMFFNRHGECPVISDESVFFIVDRNAELDILLRGDIKTINENLYLSQIYGGLDSRAMQIIEHLGSRWNSNG